MNNNVIKIIIVIVVVINIVLITVTSMSVGSAVKRQLEAESQTSTTTSTTNEISVLTLAKEIFNNDNFFAIIKTIEGINLIIFGVLIIVKEEKY